jgi:hypothetical protein
MATGQGEWKEVVIGLCRDSTYLAVFFTAIEFGRRAEQMEDVVTIQCIAFALICCCGIWQAATGLDLTVPDPAMPSFRGEFGRDSVAAYMGFMGLYRGTVGAWGAAVLGAMPLLLLRRKHVWIATPACMLVVLVGILLVGSRQGIVVGLAASALGLLGTVWATRNDASLGIRLVMVGLGVALGVGLLFQALGNSSYGAWVAYRFGGIVNSESVVDQIASRDDKIWYVVDRWPALPLPVQVLGAGRGRLDQGLPSGQHEVGYVDSELVWQLQENGLATIVIYACFLIVLWRRFDVPLRASGSARAMARVARVVLATGVCLTYGHFFLLHVWTAQAPVSYWEWALFGAALGSASRARCDGRRIAVNPRPPVRVPQPMTADLCSLQRSAGAT